MTDNRKNERLSLITFAESEVFAAEILESNNIRKDDLIPQSFFMVHDRTDDRVVGYLIDISVGGLLVIAYEPFEHNTSYSFRMDFTPVLDYERRIEFDVRCAWAINKNDIECNITGFEFTKISKDDIEIINRVINRYTAVKPL
ncbi:PilZ domain-containing protein [Candidatus Latescibacterota bacterium]